MFKKDGKTHEEMAYYITNLPPQCVTRKKMAHLIRRYWGAVENGVHVRDVALGEDACRVRTGALPRIMAAMANLAISILRLLGVHNIERTISRLRLKAGASGVMQVLLA